MRQQTSLPCQQCDIQARRLPQAMLRQAAGGPTPRTAASHTREDDLQAMRHPLLAHCDPGAFWQRGPADRVVAMAAGEPDLSCEETKAAVDATPKCRILIVAHPTWFMIEVAGQHL